jgi:hypothetical protein
VKVEGTGGQHAMTIEEIGGSEGREGALGKGGTCTYRLTHEPCASPGERILLQRYVR